MAFSEDNDRGVGQTDVETGVALQNGVGRGEVRLAAVEQRCRRTRRIVRRDPADALSYQLGLATTRRAGGACQCRLELVGQVDGCLAHAIHHAIHAVSRTLSPFSSRMTLAW